MSTAQCARDKAAAQLADCFKVTVAEAQDFVTRSARSFDELSSGRLSKILVLHQPRFRRTEEGEYVPGDGPPRLHLTAGDDEPLIGCGIRGNAAGKVAYFLRTGDSAVGISEGPPQTDKPSCEILFGEVGADALRSLDATLREAFTRHVAERSDWGAAGVDCRAELAVALQRAAASVTDMRRARFAGLALAPLDAAINLDDLVKASIARAKSKKLRLEPNEMAGLQAALEHWTTQIETYVGALAQVETSVAHAAGPQGVIDAWRCRLQQLMSVTDQLRSRNLRMTVTLLTAATKGAPDKATPALFPLLCRWKELDSSVIEAANEAEDNVKYLATLEKFIAPLAAGGSLAQAIDALPAILASAKMIFTIARYFNTPVRMTDLFVKVSHALIGMCVAHVLDAEREADDTLWARDGAALLPRLGLCLRANEVYHESFRLTREKLAAQPEGRQFAFDEAAIFGRLDSLCRRALKLIDLFSTVQQYRALDAHRLEGLAPLVREFDGLVAGLRARRHALLDFTSAAFDRDYVEFNVAVDRLEAKLQLFIRGAFSSVKSVTAALALLARLEAVLRRESLAAELHEKAGAIFVAFGKDLHLIELIYEEQKAAPPRARDMPPVAGNIAWARHLLTRIDVPMRAFASRYAHVLATREGKAVVKAYNRIVRTLIGYELVFWESWTAAVELGQAGLQATLLVRHPADGRLYVNLDAEILLLIREAKVLARLGLVLPDAARVVLLQEDKFKRYHADLSHCLRELARVKALLIPITAPLLRPALADLEYKLRPGLITLTWTSMNVDMYLQHVHAGLRRLEALVRNVNDIVTHRIEAALAAVARTSLVALPSHSAFTLDDFVAVQQEHVRRQTLDLRSKNTEIERAVRDVIDLVATFPVDAHIATATKADMLLLVEHYSHIMLQTLLHCIKSSLNALRTRVAARCGGGGAGTEAAGGAFFDLDVFLVGGAVCLSPSLDDVQSAINRTAIAVIGVTKHLRNWRFVPLAELGVRGAGQRRRLTDAAVIAVDAATAKTTAAAATAFATDGSVAAHSTGAAALPQPTAASSFAEAAAAWEDGGGIEARDLGAAPTAADVAGSFYQQVSSSIKIVRVVLLLTGSVQGTRAEVARFLASFDAFSFLWASDSDAAYRDFARTAPSVEDYDKELSRFAAVEDAIAGLPTAAAIGALALHTSALKSALRALSGAFKAAYTDNLHRAAAAALSTLTDSFRSTLSKLNRAPTDIASLKFLMDVQRDIRDTEAVIDARIAPIMDMYGLLEAHLTMEFMSKVEMDERAMLRVTWGKVVEKAVEVMSRIGGLQGGFRSRLLADTAAFKSDAAAFRDEYVRNGPGVAGLSPPEAMERLRRYEDEFDILQRKRELYANGEVLFALPSAAYPELDATAKELQLLGKLYSLYKDVMTRIDEWRNVLWADVVTSGAAMAAEMEAYAARCRKLPKKLRQWEAYGSLARKIEDAQKVLPLLQELGKPSMRPRHWEAVERITGCALPFADAEFRLSVLLDAPLAASCDEILEVTDGADKELAIQLKLEAAADKWATARFAFAPWKARGLAILAGAGGVLEELDESQMLLQTMLTMRNVGVFRAAVQTQLTALCDTAETLELWAKVQVMWCSLESVFLGGDIAKQMPAVAKRFHKIDKDFANIMSRAAGTARVVDCCANEILRMTLPPMFEELEKCQKNLESYLEQKRIKFPRFYFVSNPVLLQILSQGSDPQAIQAYYEKVFDSVSYVEHDKRDRALIKAVISREGRAEERIELRRPVKAVGNIEDWLNDLLREKRATMKLLAAACAAEIGVVAGSGGVGGADLTHLRSFVDSSCGQFALLGLQLLWTADMETALGASRKDKRAMRVAADRAKAVLTTLSAWCMQDLGSKMNRTKIETLVTMQVHMRDVADELRDRRVASTDDFDWLKQMRFYWQPDGVDALGEGGACVVRVTDVSFNYQYEYLGCKERLVVTPLTDRCYITLAQAMSMHYGGSPTGPAGTGKSETVKDMGRSIGAFVVVTNCNDSLRYNDCAKIFKGLCMAGLWGCFDEFNRITLPVLSVVAQQMLAVLAAKKAKATLFSFPGDAAQVTLNPAFGAFITTNPSYAGRQELPENLKVLFRGVAMMVPDREIIIKVKLCAAGYESFAQLARKFFVCYQLCEEQLSKQKHYDFGLRNILSVLRAAGAIKRENRDADEEMLLCRTLRDMNISKLVPQDVPLFLSMLSDLFPAVASPPKRACATMEAAVRAAAAEARLEPHDDWLAKVMQLHETMQVRHGVMLVGAAAGGKSRIVEALQAATQALDGRAVKLLRINPKAIQAHEMYGHTDAAGEWVKGVFAAIWEKYNNRDLPYNTWVLLDGPVDADWIEDLNSVLDDNKLLTLASGDRTSMTDNVKIMFETESLANASPATVSRAGIVYVSETDLGWQPIVDVFIAARPLEHQAPLRAILSRLIGSGAPGEAGALFDWTSHACVPVMSNGRAATVISALNLFAALCERHEAALTNAAPLPLCLARVLERLALLALTWSAGGLLGHDDRFKFDAYLRTASGEAPACPPGCTIFDFLLEAGSISSSGGSHSDSSGSRSRGGSCGIEWVPFTAPAWKYPKADVLDYSNLLVPTKDSARAISIIQCLHARRKAVLLVGSPGTAKTSTALIYFATLDAAKHIVKRINFSSATAPGMFQEAIDGALDKRGGKTFGPPGGKRMTVFIDDISMPAINAWGDQPTNEIVRQLIEQGGFYFLDKDKRGDFKTCEDLQFVAAMRQPGGGCNDVPNRLKRHFFIFNLEPPSMASIDDLYGQMLRGRFSAGDFSPALVAVASRLTSATLDLWQRAKARLLPTPAKFHYVFTMRELSRVFEGVLLTPKETVRSGGAQTPCADQGESLLRLWKHEATRVFEDRLATLADKAWLASTLQEVVVAAFGAPVAAAVQDEAVYADFVRDDEVDEDEVVVSEAPRVYEPGGSLLAIRARAMRFMSKYNDDFPARRLDLVLFDDALQHLARIARVLRTPRGCALLVGDGGTGKQSLVRLAAYIAQQRLFQITLTKAYNLAALKDDLRIVYKYAGHARKPITFLVRDAEIKEEAFLEYINSMLLTGDVAGLFAKEEMLAITADLQADFARARPGVPDSPDNLKQFFIDCVRDNLHVVISMSSASARFAERARRFPGLISACTIDWFLPWPEASLAAVSAGVLEAFVVDAPQATKLALVSHLGAVHALVVRACDEYFGATRRRVYHTPRSFLRFLAEFKKLYAAKLAETQAKEDAVARGLDKLIAGAADVESLKIALADERVKIGRNNADAHALLASQGVRQAEAEREASEVAAIRATCEAEAARITAGKGLCEADLAKAQPVVERAVRAVDAIKAADINEIKRLGKPSDIIRVVFDCVLLLFQRPVERVAAARLTIKKKTFEFIEPSFASAVSMMSDASFLHALQAFNKDAVSEETVELLRPYMETAEFNPTIAKAASATAEGLCTWCIAMGEYFYATKLIRPKLDALALAAAELTASEAALAAASAREAEVLADLARLKADFDRSQEEKGSLEASAVALARKLEHATALIPCLSGERTRWADDARRFAEVKRQLVGDAAVAAAFLSYCGPFNAPFREALVDRFAADAHARGMLTSPGLSLAGVTAFLADSCVVGEWRAQGLPTDAPSTHNGILVTRAERCLLLVDPQGQALSWLRSKEAARLPREPVLPLSHPKLKEALELCLAEGRVLIIVGVEDEIDPLFDPVVNRAFTTRGRKRFVTLADTETEVADGFALYFVTRLPNPHFSPELQAKVAIVDFTVTKRGLEEQLLGRVMSHEQAALERQLTQVLSELNSNAKALLDLDADLLARLCGNAGNLLDDESLMSVLAGTQAKAAELKDKLIAADEARRSISEKREQFRPAAARGAVLFFAIVDLSAVNVMYQTSLAQFLELFAGALASAERSSIASRRAANVADALTYRTYRYINRGLYERDKLLFVAVVAVKILVMSGSLAQAEVALFLRGSAAVDAGATVRRRPAWLSADSWLGALALADGAAVFAALPEALARGEATAWRRWYEDAEPESLPLPDFEVSHAADTAIGAWRRLLVVRMLRLDRMMPAVRNFVREVPGLGERYVAPVTDTIEAVYEASSPRVPTTFLLSTGADPTEALEHLARRKKVALQCVSMGEGQEPVALRAITGAAAIGSWVLLQNSELGLELMERLEDVLARLADAAHADFRLFLTALPHAKFSLGLLQASNKVANEQPAGMRAGLLRSYATIVDQDRLERIDSPHWRKLLYAMCFLHSAVQERRKFGPLGWCIPYEFGAADATACLSFLERHMFGGALHWPTVQYMVAEVQYGGKVTDESDRRLLRTYAAAWLRARMLEPGFSFAQTRPRAGGASAGLIGASTPGAVAAAAAAAAAANAVVVAAAAAAAYSVPDLPEVEAYRRHAATLPEVDSPEVYGLHPNVELTYLLKESSAFIEMLSATQPKAQVTSDGGGGGGDGGGMSETDARGEPVTRSPDEAVADKAAELLAKLPADYIDDDVRARIRKLGSPTEPMLIFLSQEVARLQQVIALTRSQLVAMQQAVRGEVVLTSALQQAMADVADARVPRVWLYTPGGDELSWLIPTLGAWFASLLDRDAQLRSWLGTGRPSAFWLAGFANPTGFIAAMKQEVVRAHRTHGWALDDVLLHAEVSDLDATAALRAPPPKEGVMVYGLTVEGARWDRKARSLAESEPRQQSATMPAVLLYVTTKALLAQKLVALGPTYSCALLRYSMRGDRYKIADIPLPCGDATAEAWCLRGVALMAL